MRGVGRGGEGFFFWWGKRWGGGWDWEGWGVGCEDSRVGEVASVVGGMGWDGDFTGLEECEGARMMGYLMNS